MKFKIPIFYKMSLLIALEETKESTLIFKKMEDTQIFLYTVVSHANPA